MTVFQRLELKPSSPFTRFKHAAELRLLGSRNVQVPVPALGLEYVVQSHSHIGRLIRQNGMYEESIVNWITRQHKADSGGVFVDVGANFGWYSCLFSKIAGKSGKVIMYEPEPTNLALLKKNLAVNESTNHSLFENAVGSAPGTAQLQLGHHCNPGAHSLIKGGSDFGSVDVSIVTLDETALPLIGEARIRIMKMDIEGFELEALRGGKGLLEKTDTLILEFSPELMEKGGFDPSELWHLIMKSGFRSFELRDGEPVSIREMPSEQCDVLFLRD